MYYSRAKQEHDFNTKQHCPFWTIQKDHIIREYEYFHVILNRGPYTAHHTLLISKRHVLSFVDLHVKELQEYVVVSQDIIQQYRNKGLEVCHLLREGFVGGKTGKTIKHLHAHFIPDTKVGAVDTGLERDFYDCDTVYHEETEKTKRYIF